MKDLENIPKKPIYSVPDDYFDKLPGRIQARITSEKPVQNPYLRFSVRYALPALVLLIIGFYGLMNRQETPATAEDILASVQTEHLVAYLHESEMTTEDLVRLAGFSSSEIDDIESAVYGLHLDDDIDLDNIDVDLDLNNL